MATSMNDLEELLTCAICLGTLSEPKLLSCSHRFCKLCIIMEMDRSASSKGSETFFPCPLCKREIKLGRGRKGEEWIVKFETDRLLKDIQEILKQVKDGAKEICSPHRKKLSLVCYSCKTTGCYICAWQDHRHCSDVKNFKDEAKQTKLELQTHLDESEKCIEKIVPYIARWSSVRKSLKNQRDYCNRFIEERLQHLQRDSVSAVEDLLQEYECYIKRTSMSKEIEQEIRRIMNTFSVKINGRFSMFDLQSRLQNQNERILWPQIQDATRRLESVQDVQILISTVENIKQVLGLCLESITIQGKDLLKQKANVLSKRYRDHLVHSMDATSPRTVQDSLVTRPEQISLGNGKGKQLLGNLKAALQNAKNPRELVETTGRLCYPDGYHPQFEIDPVPAPLTRRRLQSNVPQSHWQQNVFENTLTSLTPCVALKMTEYLRPEEYIYEVHPGDRKLRKRRYLVKESMTINGKIVAYMLYEDSTNDGKNFLEAFFHSFNSLQNKGNGEPFPTKIRMMTFPVSHPIIPTLHIFDNADDEAEGRESTRITFDEIGSGKVLGTLYTMSYGRKGFFTRFSNKFRKRGFAGKLFLVTILICIAAIMIRNYTLS